MRYRFKKNWLKDSSVRQKKQNKRKIYFFWAVFFVFVGFVFFAFCPYLQIKDIEISGMFRFSSKDYLREIANNFVAKKLIFIENRNIFFIWNKSLENYIKEKDFKIGQVAVRKIYPDKIFISIEERFPVGIIYSGEEGFLFDNEGIIFQNVGKDFSNQNLIRSLTSNSIILGEKNLEENFINDLETTFDVFENKLKIGLENIDISSSDKIIVNTKEGWKVFLAIDKNLKINLEKLKIVLIQEISLKNRVNLDYIDLRFDKIFYKFK
ncbi:MAG: FtsQ-type POTRA domain-containing protein [bacterium]|nr:FtsQ-type POTRA domain-containing protein [bacterium]